MFAYLWEILMQLGALEAMLLARSFFGVLDLGAHLGSVEPRNAKNRSQLVIEELWRSLRRNRWPKEGRCQDSQGGRVS